MGHVCRDVGRRDPVDGRAPCLDLDLRADDVTLPWGSSHPYDSYAEHFGAAIHASGASQVVSSTVVHDGPFPARAVFTTTVQNSIVISPSCGEPVIDADHNLRSPEPCGAPVPSGLGPLADNGGYTRTALPAATSLAIDAISWADCHGFTIDQRGESRIAGQPCDIGAVERQPGDA